MSVRFDGMKPGGYWEQDDGVRRRWGRVPPTAEEMNAYWDEARVKKYLANTQRDHIYHAFLDTLPPGCGVLDVGSGMSKFCRIAKERGFYPLALDISSVCIEALEELGIGGNVFDVSEWRGERWLFRDPYESPIKFVGGICSECLEHVVDPERAIALLSENVEKAWFTVPNRNCCRDPMPLHLWEFTTRGLGAMLSPFWEDVVLRHDDIYIVAETERSST